MLKIAALLSTLLLLFGSSAAASPRTTGVSCSTNLTRTGLCGNNNGSSLTVTGTRQQPPTSPRSPSTPTGPRSNPGQGPADPSEPSDDAKALAACLDDGGTTRCIRRANQPGTPPPAPAPPGTPAITITDLQRFAPTPVLATTEPDNIGIARMPTNFLAAAQVQIQRGELLGTALTVRFTPTTYDYTYGDGHTATLTTPGRTWSALDQAQLTPTPTSHIYRHPGTYTAHVDIHYTADIDLGTGWIPIPGTLTTPGPPQQIRILDAHTALVSRTCDEDPHATGC